MYNENNNQILTNDKLCVCEYDYISEKEIAIIDKVIETYSALTDKPSRWVTLDEFEKRTWRAVN